jgi:alpha-glucosidase
VRSLVCALVSSVLVGHAAILAAENSALAPIGAVTEVTRTERGVQLSCADGSSVAVSILAPDLVRVRAQFAGQPAAKDHSWAIAKTDWPRIDFTVQENADALTLGTGELHVVVRRNPLLIEFRDAATGRVFNADHRPIARDPKSGRIGASKKLGFEEHFYGLGEKAARLDKRRGKFTMWNSDTPGYEEGKDPIYQSVPFYLGLEDGQAYGLFFDNSYRSTFEFGHLTQEAAEYSAEGGELNYYYFHGPALKKIVGRYTELTGRMAMPPLWALGHQQSRYSYYPDTMLDRVVEEYRKRDLPLDAVYLDIHYMEGYRVFTWDRTRFPDPAALTKRLGEKGVKVVTIVDPGVKQQPPKPGATDPEKDRDLASAADSYYVFNEGIAKDYFLHRQDGSLWIGEVWPGKSVFVDYTKEEARRWWGDLHRALTDRGIAGVWTDMNEPADFIDQTGKTQMDVVFDDLGQLSPYAKNRNTFALNMARATYEGLQRLQPDRRPFVITRAGYAGIQRYAVKWTGDNNATFAAVGLNVPMFASLGISGQAFVGADIPGFIGRGDGELLARSYQIAVFAPFLRNHTAIDQYDKEPWRFGRHYEDIVRKFLKLRYALMPFLYTTIEEAHRTGVPLFRPLVLNFQHDYNTVNLDDQFMVGDALLAAPVTRAAQREREVYLPEGVWFDFWTGQQHPGGQMLRAAAPLDHLPLYVRGGSIVPSTQPMNHTGEKPWSPLRFTVYPDANGRASGTLYEDDGISPAHQSGAFRRTNVTFIDGKLALASEGSFATPARDFEIVLHAGRSVAQVSRNGQPLAASVWSQQAGVVTVRVPDQGQPFALEFR